MKKDSTTRKMVILLLILIAAGCQPQNATPVGETPSPSTSSPIWKTETPTAIYSPSPSPTTTPTPYILEGFFVFSDFSYIFKVDAISGDAHILSDNGNYFNQVWLGNGYVYYIEGYPHTHLYRMKHDGSDIEQMEGGRGILDFDISSDGRHLAYVPSEGKYIPPEEDIILVEFDESGTTVIRRTVLQGTRRLEALIWTNDGKRLAFLEWPDNEDGEDGAAYGSLYIVDADGQNLKQIQSGDLRISAYYPDWSPDGTTIAVPMKDQYGINLYTIDVDRNEIRPLTSMAGEVEFPLWSPDGTKILFRLDEQLCVIDSDGSSFQVLADQIDWTHRTHPAIWSPDGHYIAYVGTRDKLVSLYIIPSTGGAPRSIGSEQYHINDISWVLPDR